MTCPTCNHLNPATVARCLNCGTTLIYEAVGHSAEYTKAAHSVDSKMHAGLGGIAGFFVVAVLLKFIFTAHWLSDQQVYLWSVGGAVVGSIIGRLVLRLKN